MHQITIPNYLRKLFVHIVFVFSCFLATGQTPKRTEGDGPYKQLIIRAINIIDGTGNPVVGPADIVIENNRIASITIVGSPGHINKNIKRPELISGGKEIDGTGKYIMPGFFDMHGHIKSWVDDPKNFEYEFKLLLAHGITSIVDPGCGAGLDLIVETKEKSKTNEIVAPRIKAYQRLRRDNVGRMIPNFNTPEIVRAWVQDIKKRGADGIKFELSYPDLMLAATDEAKKIGLGMMAHHGDNFTARWDALNSAKAGIVSFEHFYGYPEMMLANTSIPDWPDDFNYYDEHQRFLETAKVWLQTVSPHSEKWNNAIDSLLKYDVTLDPTFNVYEANRDVRYVTTSEWNQYFMIPKLWQSYSPGFGNVHAAYFRSWGTENEIAWKKVFNLWMEFVNEFKNRGGRVTTGTDNNILHVYGFSFVRELELLREAGFTPLEIIKAATLNSAEALKVDKDLGTIRVGKLADLVIVTRNPLADLSSLYGTGVPVLDEKSDRMIRIGGVEYTIKDGIVYDAKQLLKEVAEMVKKEKQKENFKFNQWGFSSEFTPPKGH